MIADSPAVGANAKPYTVSELAFALKRTLEDSYGYVRLRGELSKVTRHASGHCYLSLKDDKACIDGVVWKTAVRGLQMRPEQGLEVIVTGRITTYPASSKYQIVIETMEAAGVGALLAQLERLKAKLREEGLFDTERKRPLPSMPATIGVITSPTGAVIRDILHRIADRWPCRVLIWPVVVQGDAAAAQVIAAVEGFNALGADGGIGRPEVVIVARGGGSVEDLWPFNDEGLARAVAGSEIPLISAVGHETDTTLIDFVSDRRAPTPTAAAEMASPVIADLRAALRDYRARLTRCGARTLEERGQRFDLAASRLGAALDRNVASHRQSFLASGARLTPGLLRRAHEMRTERVAELGRRLATSVRRSAEQEWADISRGVLRVNDLNMRLNAAVGRNHAAAGERLARLEQLRLSLNPDRPLERGFARVRRADGALARAGAELRSGEAVELVFAKDSRMAVIDAQPATRRSVAKAAAPAQGNLF